MRRLLRYLAKAIRSRFSTKLLIFISAAVVIPAGALLLTGLVLFEGAVRESVRAELRSSLDRAERDLTSFLADLVAASGAAANAEEIRDVLVSRRSEFELTRIVDRSFDTILATLPGRESVSYTLVGSSRIFTSWSKNFHDYGFLRDLPLVRRAAERAGHVVWEGLSPSYIIDEPNRESLVSVARAVPADPPSQSGVLILQADREALRRYFRDRRVSASFASLFLAGGKLVVDTVPAPLPADVVAGLDGLASNAAANASVFEARLGHYLAAGRRLDGLPDELFGQGWTVVVLYDYRDLDRRFSTLRALFAPSFCVLLVLALVVSYFASRRIVHPLAELSMRMEAWNPNAPAMAALDREDEIGVLSRSFARMHGKVAELFSSLQREHQVKEMFRYRALRAQLNPHFLFNSLSTIRWMAIIRKADNIAEAVNDLSGLLSYSMGKEGDRSTLREEIESVKRYLGVQNLRYGGRFCLDCSIAEELLGCESLRFMLQPLVENCLIHAYQGLSRAGTVEISARKDGDCLTLEVADRGVGPQPEEESDREGRAIHDDARTGETGIGLASVRDMLAITYGPASSLELRARDGGGAVVVVRMPLADRPDGTADVSREDA